MMVSPGAPEHDFYLDVVKEQPVGTVCVTKYEVIYKSETGWRIVGPSKRHVSEGDIAYAIWNIKHLNPAPDKAWWFA